MALLSLNSIGKEFPGVTALSDVSFDLAEGEVHALIGENGAGKSTLIKVLGGVYPAGTYRGDIVMDGQPRRFHSVHDSERAGIRIIHQELLLVPNMTVAENLFLGDEPLRAGVIDYAAMHRQAQPALDQLQCTFSPADVIEGLTVGHRQLVEIAKAISKQARVIVFDEPTAALPEKDAQNLLALIEGLAKRGIGIIYISHKLNEVIRIADRITVLRNGRTVSSFLRGTFLPSRLVSDMLGRSMESAYPPLAQAGAETILDVHGLTLRRSGRLERAIINGVSFGVKQGEVVGIAGLLGSGRTALLSFLFGAFDGIHSGTVSYAGTPYAPVSPADAIGRGIALVTEDRKRYGLLSGADVRENLCISSLAQFVRAFALDWAAMSARSREYAQRLNIKTPSIDADVDNLSGGNQQKTILGRFLMTSPRLLLLDDPTRGVDVGAKYEFYRLIHELAGQGMGIIFVSSELPEVLGVAHRIYVLHDGTIGAEFSHGEAREEAVLAVAAGVGGAEPHGEH